ncbi:MAG: hypothetical protein AB1714_29990 [Acidobacteriota bacterium]
MTRSRLVARSSSVPLHAPCPCVARALLLVAVLSCTQLQAQTNDEGLANLAFTFLNPGARALGMGGAFLGMADDATTALANPAGLVNLVTPEASVEFSSSAYANEIPWTGGSVSYIKNGPVSSDFRYTFQPADNPTTLNYISFASIVYPLVPRKLVISGFYDGQTGFERGFKTLGFRKFENGEELGPFLPNQNALSMHMRSLGGSLGYQLGNRLSVGATLAYSRFSMDSQTTRFIDAGMTAPSNSESLKGDQGKLTVTIGGLCRISERLSLGAVYTRRPEYDLTSTFRSYPGPESYPLAVRFKVPDKFGAGLSLRASESLSVNLDVVRILSAQLMDGYYNAYCNPDTSPDTVEGRDSFEVASGTELRMGLEHTMLLRDFPVAVRAGYWREPYHSMVRKVEDAQIVIYGTPGFGDEPFFSRSFINASNHFTVGGGIATSRISIDAAFDYSKPSKRFVLSAVVYLPAPRRKAEEAPARPQRPAPGVLPPGALTYDPSRVTQVGSRLSVAVLPFEWAGAAQDSIESMRDRLTSRLDAFARFQMIPKGEWEALLLSSGAALTGPLDDTAAVKAGRGAGVDAVICGSVIETEGTGRVTARLIDTETGETVVTKETLTSAADLASILKLAGDIATLIYNEMPLVEGCVLDAGPDRVYLDVGRDAGVKMGTRCTVFREGSDISDPVTGAILGKKWEKLGELVAIEVQPRISIARPVGKVQKLRPGDRVVLR